MKRQGRTEAEVSARIQIAKAARVAMPGMGQDRLAFSLGVSRGQLRNYLRDRCKRFYHAPSWALQFFRACAAIGQRDNKTAAAELRDLAATLEKES